MPVDGSDPTAYDRQVDETLYCMVGDFVIVHKVDKNYRRTSRHVLGHDGHIQVTKDNCGEPTKEHEDSASTDSRQYPTSALATALMQLGDDLTSKENKRTDESRSRHGKRRCARL